VDQGVGSLQGWKRACDNLILSWRRFRVVHLQFHIRIAERIGDLLKNLVFLRPSGQRRRIAPPMLVDGFDGLGVFEKDKFTLEPYEEMDARFLLRLSLKKTDSYMSR
jgi:hypothetical protein